MVQFTVYEVWTFVIATIGLVLTLLNIVDRWAVVRQRRKAPEEEQNRRITDLEKDVDHIKGQLSNDRKAIEDVQRTNALLIKGTLALLEIQSHSDASATNSAQIKAIQDEMQHFLIAKGLTYEKAETCTS